MSLKHTQMLKRVVLKLMPTREMHTTPVSQWQALEGCCAGSGSTFVSNHPQNVMSSFVVGGQSNKEPPVVSERLAPFPVRHTRALGLPCVETAQGMWLSRSPSLSTAVLPGFSSQLLGWKALGV